MKPDVLIIGAGVIGAAVARALARAGVTVRVLDADRPGGGASSAAAGMLTPHPDAVDPQAGSPFLDLCRRSLALFPELVAALRGETGIDVEHREEGSLELALEEDDIALIRGRLELRRAAGFAGEWIEAPEVRRREPCLSPVVRGAALLPDDTQVENRRLVRALARAAARAGARLESGRAATGLIVERGRVRGARCGADRLEAGQVVLAAGCGSAPLARPVRELPVEPVRGQIVCLGTDGTMFRHVILSPRGYLVPRRDGRVLAGSTMERVGHDPRPTAAGVAGIAAAAATLAPALAGAPFLSAWAGLRPCTPDLWPILGPDEELPGLIHASGHGPNGILLAPISAEWVARAVAGQRPPLDPAPFRPGRFGAGERAAVH